MKEYINHDNCENNDIKCKATNTLSILVGIVTLSVYVIFNLRNILIGREIDFWDLGRLLFVSILSFASYILHKNGYRVLSKILLIYSFIFFLIYYPVFFNYYSPDIYMLYPLYTILLGVFTQIIFYFIQEKYYYIFVMISLYLVLLFTDEVYSIRFDELDLKTLWGSDYFVIKLGFVTIFTTINAILFYIIKKNKEAQKEVIKKSIKINKKNDLIRQKNDSLSAKNKQLKEHQEEIAVQNEELHSFMEEIKSQRDEIESKNNEIIDSIMYASRIQNSMIPKGKILYSYFEDYFILNKPKDILSGDFFWTAEYDNKVIVVVADCTGHGIPASLLSVLGISSLNEIILKYKNLKPNEILNHLRTKIIIALSQSDSNIEQKDGMDISLMIYDKTTKVVEYSGAYNPFVVVRENKIFSIDGDRMPIGICEAENSFSYNTFKVEKDDVIYMFSDGYTDQFGGEKNKKLKRIRFKEQLIKLSKLPMVVQKERFSLFFNEWKGKNEQVDDVLIIGLKVK